ncbi:MAG TPA: hypothetical protein EYO18_07025, partial [Candidatus Marinimicrobia bacterium]|nr:hypothetical protein [Candidatus Neomarinimicrobiota bacterium]
MVVDHNNDGDWNVIDSLTGASAGWELITIELPEEFRSSYTKLGFLLDTDVSINGPGAYIDDINVLLGSQPVVTTTQDDIVPAIEEMVYSLPILFTDTDGASANDYQVELAGSAAAWLSVSGVNGGDGDYTIDITGVPDDENIYENILSVIVTDATGIQSQPAGFTLEIVAVNDVPEIIQYVGDTDFDEDT